MPLNASLVDGFCGYTTDGEVNDCRIDSFGSFGLQPEEAGSWREAVHACSSLCRACARCDALAAGRRVDPRRAVRVATPTAQ